MRVIYSVEEFKASLMVGDKFWTISTFFGKPTEIEGPMTIVRYDETERDVGNEKRIYEMVSCALKLLFDRDFTYDWYVADLVNSMHGVTLSKEDAKLYFKERLRAFNADPEAQRRHVIEVEDFERQLRTLFSKFYM